MSAASTDEAVPQRSAIPTASAAFRMLPLLESPQRPANDRFSTVIEHYSQSSSTTKMAVEPLYPLTVARLHHRHGNLLDLGLSIAAHDFQGKPVLPSEIALRPVNGDKSRQLHAEAILHIGCPQFGLLDRDLAVRRRIDEPHRGQRSRSAVFADGGKDTSVDVRVRFAFDLALHRRLLAERGSRQRRQKAQRG